MFLRCWAMSAFVRLSEALLYTVYGTRAFADQVAGPGPDDVLSLCTALGGPGPCATFCQAPQLDERQPLTRNPNAYLYPNPTTLTLTPALPTVRPRCG